MTILHLEQTTKFSVWSIPLNAKTQDKAKTTVFVDLNCAYTQKIVLDEFNKRADEYDVIKGPGHGDDAITPPNPTEIQFAEYERIQWAAVLSGKLRASSYCVRKGLSRKAQLAHYTSKYIQRKEQQQRSSNTTYMYLKQAMPFTIVIDTWPAFSVDTNKLGNDSGSSLMQRIRFCLQEAEQAMSLPEHKDYMWILKPSTVNKGTGIKIVHCFEEVVETVLDLNEISREFVLQRYIDRPLLLRRRKFHIRAYALAVSALQVYLYDDVLALCSGTKYSYDTTQILAHITNTAYQAIDPNFSEEKCVLTLNEVKKLMVRDKTCRDEIEAAHIIEKIQLDMQNITGELFAAYKGEYAVFAPIHGCFEHFGLDFVVDEDFSVYLLEVNPGPDFRQTGDKLSGIISGLMASTIDVAISGKSEVGTGLTKVYEESIRTGGGGKINMKFS